MGGIAVPEPVKLVFAITGQTEAMLHRAVGRLEEAFGPVDSESDIYPFTFSEYYATEMGSSLIKRFCSMATPVDPEALADIKLASNVMECGLPRPDGLPGRGANLDPGYVNGAQLVLATTKNYSHRLYLGAGIFAEITLIYQRGGFQPMPWTYPDYRTELALAYFEQVRRLCLERR